MRPVASASPGGARRRCCRGAALAARRRSADLVDAWRAAQGTRHGIRRRACGAATRAKRGASRAHRSGGRRCSSAAAAGVANNDSSTTGARFSAPGFGTRRRRQLRHLDQRRHGDALGAAGAPAAVQPRARCAASASSSSRPTWPTSNGSAAQQALMLRVAERYFDAALAVESLRVLRRQQEAVERSLLEARDRFKLGDAPVTDTHEAAARAQAIRAEVLAAETNADAQAGGAVRPALAGRATKCPRWPWRKAACRRTCRHWRLGWPMPKRATCSCACSRRSIEVARQEAAKYSAAAAPSVDLVAQAGAGPAQRQRRLRLGQQHA